MAEVCNPPLLSVAVEALDHGLDSLRHALMGTVQDAGVGVALESNAPVAANLDSLGGILEPVEANDVVANVNNGVESVPGALGEDGHGHALQVHLGELLGEVLGDVGQVRLAELLEGLGAELAGPRVKDHDHLGAGLDLQREVLDTDLGNLLQERLGLLGVAVDPRLALHEELGAAALDHVAEERPGGAAESDEGHAAGELLAGEGDCLVDVVELGGNVDVLGQDLFVLPVGRRLERLGEVGALLVDHLDRHTEGLGHDEDVGEDDGGVEEAGEAFNGLQGQGAGDLGVTAAGEEVAGTLGFVVLGEVAAGFFVGVRNRLCIHSCPVS